MYPCEKDLDRGFTSIPMKANTKNCSLYKRAQECFRGILGYMNNMQTLHYHEVNNSDEVWTFIKVLKLITAF